MCAVLGVLNFGIYIWAEKMGVTLNNDSRGYVNGQNHLSRIISLESFFDRRVHGGRQPPRESFSLIFNLM